MSPIVAPSGTIAQVPLTRAELESYRGATLPDLVAPGLSLVFVGINPGLMTAATGTHFGRRGNRFYPALRMAGLLASEPEPGRTPHEELLSHGIGVTNLVARATARADELTREELRHGPAKLADFEQRWHPAVLAILGVTAYRVAFGQPSAAVGQAGRIGAAEVWVAPNPSGLNAHDNVASLAAAYREIGVAAGLSST